MRMDVSLPWKRTVTETFYLAFTAWREARGEARLVRRAVMFSILNRVERPKWWGRTVDEVCTKREQYSSLTHPGDPQLASAWPTMADPIWLECVEDAYNLLWYDFENPVPGADSYHDLSISTPKEMATGRDCGVIGRIHFWDVDHDYEAAVTGHGA